MERHFLVCYDENQKRDSDIAHAVVEHLEQRGLNGYLADRDMVVGQSVFQALEEAMLNTPAILLLLSEAALHNDFFSLTMTEGLLETLLKEQVKLLPIFIDLHPSKRPAVLTSIMGLRYEDCNTFWNKLYGAIRRLST